MNNSPHQIVKCGSIACVRNTARKVVFSSLIATSQFVPTGNNSELAVKGQLTEEKMKLVCSVLISALVIAFVQQSLQDNENAIPVVINRRLLGDIHYSDYPDKFSTCNDRESSNFTYLVEERLCVTSSELQKGKNQTDIV